MGELVGHHVVRGGEPGAVDHLVAGPEGVVERAALRRAEPGGRAELLRAVATVVPDQVGEVDAEVPRVPARRRAGVVEGLVDVRDPGRRLSLDTVVAARLADMVGGRHPGAVADDPVQHVRHLVDLESDGAVAGIDEHQLPHVGTPGRADLHPPDRPGALPAAGLEQGSVVEPAPGPVRSDRPGRQVVSHRRRPARQAGGCRRRDPVRRRLHPAARLAGHGEQGSGTVENGHQLSTQHGQPVHRLLEPHQVVAVLSAGGRQRAQPGGAGQAERGAVAAQVRPRGLDRATRGRRGGRERVPGRGPEQADPAGAVPDDNRTEGIDHVRRRGRSGFRGGSRDCHDRACDEEPDERQQHRAPRSGGAGLVHDAAPGGADGRWWWW